MKNILEKKIEKVIKKIRPYIQMHGGDVFLVSVKKGIVTLQITGACTHCSLANLTYNKMLGGLLKEEVPEVKEIILIK
ncbi:MAG: NifU family protein [Patescibacteria group bacterium]